MMDIMQKTYELYSYEVRTKVKLSNDELIILSPDRRLRYETYGISKTFDSSQSISVLGETETGNHKAILTFNYNSGHVFIISCHPEFDVTKQSRKIIRNAIMWCAQLK
jgi:hypothetical protein